MRDPPGHGYDHRPGLLTKATLEMLHRDCPKLWREGYVPCPGFKCNWEQRLDIAARRLGYQPEPVPTDR